MKKTSTLKHAEPVSKSKAGTSLEEQEPDEQTIANILNYSKALSVRKSSFLQHLIQINN